MDRDLMVMEEKALDVIDEYSDDIYYLLCLDNIRQYQ